MVGKGQEMQDTQQIYAVMCNSVVWMDVLESSYRYKKLNHKSQEMPKSVRLERIQNVMQKIMRNTKIHNWQLMAFQKC